MQCYAPTYLPLRLGQYDPKAPLDWSDVACHEMAYSFLSNEAERALRGDAEADEDQLLYPTPAPPVMSPTAQQQLPVIDNQAQWIHVHTSSAGRDFFHPEPLTRNGAEFGSLGIVPKLESGGFGPEWSPETAISSTSVGALGMTATTAAMISEPSTAMAFQESATLQRQQRQQHLLPTLPSMPHDSSMRPGSPSWSSNPTSHSIGATPPPSRSQTPLSSFGMLDPESQTWRCAYPGCMSKAKFARPCDLRKHFHRHSKQFFCRNVDCPQHQTGGFSSKKDRARHEARHNPTIKCEWPDCDRVFSRMDNMRDHYARIHYKAKPAIEEQN